MKDGRTFTFRSRPRTQGPFAAEIEVEVLLGSDDESIHRVVKVRGEAKNTVFSSPAKLLILQTGKRQEFSIRVRHITQEPICIDDIVHGRAVAPRRAASAFSISQIVELTFLPCPISEPLNEIKILGRTKSGVSFCLVVPITIIPQRKEE